MKDGWYEISKGETPENIIGYYEVEDYHTPSRVYIDDNCTIIKTHPTQDLHYMTGYVICLWVKERNSDNLYVLDRRRKFDSKSEWIWHRLEGGNVEYWKPIPEPPVAYFAVEGPKSNNIECACKND